VQVQCCIHDWHHASGSDAPCPPPPELRALPPSPVTQRLLADLTGTGPQAPHTLHISSPCTLEELATLGRAVASFGPSLRNVVLARVFGTELPEADPLASKSTRRRAAVSVLEALVGASPGLECLKYVVMGVSRLQVGVWAMRRRPQAL
jgi:hypothetical protein